MDDTIRTLRGQGTHTPEQLLAMTLEEWTSKLSEGSEEFFRRHPGDEIRPFIMMILPEGREVVMPFQWADEAERRIVLALLRRIVQTVNPVRYAIVNEGWHASYPVGSDLRDPTVARPMDRPDRVEVVSTIAVQRDGKALMRVQKMIRGEAGTVIRLEPMTGIDAAGGDFTTLYR